MIEDNSTDVFLIKEALTQSRLDAQLTVITDGEAALAYFQHFDTDENATCPDVVLLDINLPRVNGFTVLRSLRQSPRCAHIPVIVTTSSDALADRARATELGATMYFPKPPEYDAFLRIGELIRKVLAGESV